jgi:hypothetical protein
MGIVGASNVGVSNKFCIKLLYFCFHRLGCTSDFFPFKKIARGFRTGLSMVNGETINCTCLNRISKGPLHRETTLIAYS